MKVAIHTKIGIDSYYYTDVNQKETAFVAIHTKIGIDSYRHLKALNAELESRNPH